MYKVRFFKINKRRNIKQNTLNKKILFNLVVTGSKCEKIMNYLSNNKDFRECISSVCIYCKI